MERWQKVRFKRTIKELNQSDNENRRSSSWSVTILIWIIRIQVRFSKAVTSWL